MERCQVCGGSIGANPILHRVDVEEVYSRTSSRGHSIQRHVRSKAGPHTVGVKVLMIAYEAVPLCYYITGSNPGTCPTNNLNIPSALSIKHAGQSATT
jgi:hypothetical protein